MRLLPSQMPPPSHGRLKSRVWWAVPTLRVTDQRKRSAKVLVLFPELCLFWPVALVLEVRRKKTAKKVGDERVD